MSESEDMTPLGNVDIQNESKKLRARQDAMQKKTFTKWYNSYLIQRGLKVDDLFTDLSSGIMLFNLLEILSGEKITPKVQTQIRFTPQKLENAQACLNFLKRKGIEVSMIGSSDIVNGNEVLILGLSWMLILRFEVQKFSADTQELLRWCKKRTADYPNVKVENFTSSFTDGMALNALIHKHFPNLINYDALDPKDAIGNINNALDVAERELGVPKLLDANDLAQSPEEKSIITYVARLRQALSDREEELKLAELRAEEDAKRRAAEEDARRRAAEEEARRLAAEEARRRAEEEARRRAEEEARRRAEEEAERLRAEEEARRRAEEEARRRAEEEAARKAAERKKAIDDLNDLLPNFLNRAQHEKETDDLIKNYNLRAKELADWIKDRDDRMKDAVQRGDLGDTLDEVQDKLDHIRDGVDDKEQEKLDLESLNNDINTRLKLENRPRPHHEVPMEVVNNLWKEAIPTEQGYKKALLDRKEELKRLEASLDRFRRISAKLQDWVNMCSEVMNRYELGNSVIETTELIAEHERFTRDTRAQLKTMKELAGVAKLLPRHPEVEQTMAHLNSIFDPLPQRIKDRMDALQKELIRQKQIETQRLKYFEDIRDFEEYLFAAEEYALHPVESDNDQSILAVLEPLRRVAQAIKLPEQATPEEEAELQEARARLDNVLPLLEGRRASIRDEAHKKKQGEDLYQKFARSATSFESWYHKMSTLIAEDGTAEVLRQRARSVQSSLGEGQTHINNASGTQSSIDSLGLPGPNPYTTLSVSSLQNMFDHLKKWADDRSELLQNPLPATNASQVVRSLDILTEDKGKIDHAELSQYVSLDAADYIKEKAPSDGSGLVDYARFNPYPEETVNRRASPPSSVNTRASATPPTTSASTPENKRASFYGTSSASKSRGSIYGSQTPPTHSSPIPASPVTRSAPSPVVSRHPVEDDHDASLPTFEDSMRKKKEMEEGVFLYTTQTTTSPLAVRYEIECSKYEIIEFRVSFENSENIKLLKPKNDNLIAITEVAPFTTRVVAIIQQIDPYKPASLKTKYSWTSRVPS